MRAIIELDEGCPSLSTWDGVSLKKGETANVAWETWEKIRGCKDKAHLVRAIYEPEDIVVKEDVPVVEPVISNIEFFPAVDAPAPEHEDPLPEVESQASVAVVEMTPETLAVAEPPEVVDFAIHVTGSYPPAVEVEENPEKDPEEENVPSPPPLPKPSKKSKKGRRK
jgi:hypothetical protein